jgi:hypothetical protein
MVEATPRAGNIEEIGIAASVRLCVDIVRPSLARCLFLCLIRWWWWYLLAIPIFAVRNNLWLLHLHPLLSILMLPLSALSSGLLLLLLHHLRKELRLCLLGGALDIIGGFTLGRSLWWSSLVCLP